MMPCGMLLGIPRCASAGETFAICGLPSCGAMIRRLVYGFMCRLTESENELIKSLVDPTTSDIQYTIPYIGDAGIKICIYSLLYPMTVLLHLYDMCVFYILWTFVPKLSLK